MSSIFNIFFGIVAGIITYIIIQFMITIFNNIVIPWYQRVIYKGFRIEGEWCGYGAKIENRAYTIEKESESTIILEQQGNKIVGELLLIKQPNGREDRKIFELNGSFIDTILILESRAKDNKNMGLGTFILKLTENGLKLKGKHTFISAHDWSTVVSRDVVLIRKNST